MERDELQSWSACAGGVIVRGCEVLRFLLPRRREAAEALGFVSHEGSRGEQCFARLSTILGLEIINVLCIDSVTDSACCWFGPG